MRNNEEIATMNVLTVYSLTVTPSGVKISNCVACAKEIKEILYPLLGVENVLQIISSEEERIKPSCSPGKIRVIGILIDDGTFISIN